MLYGAPKKGSDVFTNLGFDVTPRDSVVVTTDTSTSTFTIDTQTTGLQQLTTRPVAGFVASDKASSTYITYAEQGTGHIYQIDTLTGAETLLSRTTIPRVRTADFSPDGEAVALTSITGYTSDTYVGLINNSTQAIKGTSLPPNAENINLPNNESIQYTRVDEKETTGYTYQHQTGEQRALFTLPFTAITMLWGENETYAYNKPASELLGYLYKITNGSFSTTAVSGYGLVATLFNDRIFYNSYKDEERATYLHNQNADDTQIPITLVPEKCTATASTSAFWCANSFNIDAVLDTWYRGEVTYNDNLWEVQTDNQQSILKVQVNDSINRSLDITNLQYATDNLYFINKTDNTLWQYQM